MKNHLCISGVQFDIAWENKGANFRKIETFLKDLPPDTDILLLPEMFNTGFSMNVEYMAETMNGETIQWMRQISCERKIVIAGSLMIKEGSSYFNRLVWVQPDNDIFIYDKRHLIGISGEDKHFTIGKLRQIIDYHGWKILLSICYDLRFPVWMKNRSDYDLIINVASWPSVRSSHWNAFLKSRAIENQAYLVGINRIGNDGNSATYDGDSSIYDFNGQLMSYSSNIESTVNATLSYSSLTEYRMKYPFLKDSDQFFIK